LGGGLIESPTARVHHGPSDSFYLSYKGVAKAALYCAHRATTVSSWGLCEQKGHLAAPSLSLDCPFHRLL